MCAGEFPLLAPQKTQILVLFVDSFSMVAFGLRFERPLAGWERSKPNTEGAGDAPPDAMVAALFLCLDYFLGSISLFNTR
jgi:hypothetical protein